MADRSRRRPPPAVRASDFDTHDAGRRRERYALFPGMNRRNILTHPVLVVIHDC